MERDARHGDITRTCPEGERFVIYAYVLHSYIHTQAFTFVGFISLDLGLLRVMELAFVSQDIETDEYYVKSYLHLFIHAHCCVSVILGPLWDTFMENSKLGLQFQTRLDPRSGRKRYYVTTK